jgi:hypothetical protein
MTLRKSIAGSQSEGGQIGSKWQLWAGRTMTVLAILFFLMDAFMKLLKPPMVVKATVELGYPESTIVGIGVALLACTLFYTIPRTSVFGAILLTGYLGGAIASKIRVGGNWADVVFVLAFASLVWGGLWLRDIRLRRLFH